MAMVDPELVRELDARRLEFEEVDLPRFQTGFPPQHLMMTLLGDYWSGRREALPSAALVALLAEFDLNEAGARAALSRLAHRDNLVIVKQGRYTSYRVADRVVELLPYASQHTRSFQRSRTGWNGQWTVIACEVVDNARKVRASLKVQLASLGFAPLYENVWVSPSTPDARLDAALARFPEASCTVSVGSIVDSPGRRSPLAGWDLEKLRRAYDDFLESFGSAAPRPRSRSDALVTRTRVAYRWFVIATTDPDLPAELLPPDWPRDAAYEVFADLFDDLGPRAEERVREILAHYDTNLPALVTPVRTRQPEAR
jgi:phenylacetic acid degradation operon negative regulatory protein